MPESDKSISSPESPSGQTHESWWRQAVSYALFTLAAALIVVVARVVLHANQTTVALLFVILILFTAFRRPLAYSIYLSILCTVLYNYYFLPPVGSLVIADPQNLVTLLVFLGAGISVNHISAKQRRQAESLAIQRQEIEKLYGFSRRMLLEDKWQELSKAVPALIAENFQLRAVALYLPGHEAAFMWDPERRLAGMENLHDATQPGSVTSRSSAGIHIVPLMLGMRALGVLAMAESSSYSEGFYDAIGSLTAVFLERAAALERNSRSEAAREGELLRTALLDSITHELRTPLTVIRLAATTLAGDTALNPEASRDLLSVINEESERMNALIDEAVTMAQLSTGEVHLRKEPANFLLLLDAVLESLRTSLRDRAVRLDVACELPLIVMDADLIRRVLKHLLENAIQYSPAKSPIEVLVTFEQQQLHVAVHNLGPAIAEQDQAYVFDRFFRGANGGAHPNGTGMGLAIVKTIVEAHQGLITMRSSSDEGITFLLTIPVVQEEAAAEEVELQLGGPVH